MTNLLPKIVHIYLPSSLKWQEIQDYAQIHAEQGSFLIWDFDFPIRSSITDEVIVRGWELTLEHFKKTLFLQFEHITKGVIFYKGPSDFSLDQGWMFEDEERYVQFLNGKQPTFLRKRLFCRDEGFEKLKELAPFLPENIPLYLLFNHSCPLLAELCYDHFILGAKTPYRGLSLWNWQGNSLQQPNTVETKRGLVLPHLVSMEEEDFARIDAHLNSHPDCRLIPESVLTQEWQGLDTLFVFSHLITFQGKRKLQGFEATGGLILNV